MSQIYIDNLQYHLRSKEDAEKINLIQERNNVNYLDVLVGEDEKDGPFYYIESNPYLVDENPNFTLYDFLKAIHKNLYLSQLWSLYFNYYDKNDNHYSISANANAVIIYKLQREKIWRVGEDKEYTEKEWNNYVQSD